MTDITTRLLSMSEAMYFDIDQEELDALLLEAKAEIERLREAHEEIVDIHGSTPASPGMRSGSHCGQLRWKAGMKWAQPLT
ncbi:hypothetical protein [Rhizobium phaseoli]|uniref:Uncharacterized protein n=1 Tax=Rhizobium phaseoli TaxID=396 RepID=A0ABM6C8T7_9HYPH|nr:hypothetical protein [Rhizobium phaseoli]ANL84619.1 hypothetical protein AMC81_CH01838 [Rhizobium phaseoli]ANL91126.1 hypothetical protein AMC80_CH01838 [Rhizobium phaseoli]